MIDNRRIISTEDGRKLRVVEAGQPDGIPILALHGTPGSSLLFQPWIKDAENRGIHLISYDRPGYGGSTPQPGRTIASAAEDVAAIAKELKLNRLCVWGKSGGGPHALACAALLPDLVVAAAALASPAPYNADGLYWLAGMGEDNIEEFNAALKGRNALEEYVEAATPVMMNSTPLSIVQAYRSLLCPADAAVLTEDFASFLLDSAREGIRERRDGWIDDDIAKFAPWGFELSQMQTPVLIMHGEQDQMVPFSHRKWLASRITNVDTRFLTDDGHLTISANRIPEVHTWLLSKM